MVHKKKQRLQPLTKVKKVTRATKSEKIQKIRSFVNQYNDIYVIYYKNESAKAIDSLRLAFPETRFCFDSNAILGHALGKTQEESAQPRTYLLSKLLSQKACLMFTNQSLETIRETLNNLQIDAFIQGGQVAPRTVTIPAGHLNKDLFAWSIEPELRRLGLPTMLDNEVVLVTADYTICKEGQIVNGAQAALLRHFNEKLSNFQVELVGCWIKKDQDILLLKDECAAMLD